MIDYSQTIRISEPETHTRLDIVLAHRLQITRSQVKKMIRHNEILVNNSLPKKSGDLVTTGDIITFQIHTPIQSTDPTVSVSMDTGLLPEIIDETAEYIVINKPAGLLTHPTLAKESWSVAHWIWKTYPELTQIGEYQDRPGIVHRLDKDTSGLMVIAKSQDMFEHLKQQFKARTIDKRYTTLVHGVIERDIDIIDFNIDRGTDGRMVARPNIDPLKVKNVGKQQPGKEAKTEFFVRSRYSRYTLLEVKIYTGRTHQIRVHMFAYNHPVVGDPLYTHTKLNRNLDATLNRLFLHAHALQFTTPDGVVREYHIPLPETLAHVLENLQ
jgi:23S rRNA pseudouridine1911/1915/1917 synthase